MNNRTGAAIDAAMSSAADKTTWGGAAMGFVGWLASINWIGLIGVLVAVIGLAANIWFQYRKDRRESTESKARLAALKNRAPHRRDDVSAEMRKFQDGNS